MGEEKIDFTRGGRYLKPAPDSFYDEEGLSYWEKMNQFVDYLDSSLPPGFSLNNTSAYRENKVVDKKGNVVSTGKSHTSVPSHDFVIRSDDEGYQPDEDELWSMYQKHPSAPSSELRYTGRRKAICRGEAARDSTSSASSVWQDRLPNEGRPGRFKSSHLFPLGSIEKKKDQKRDVCWWYR